MQTQTAPSSPPSVTERGAIICTHGRPKGICGECFPSESTIDRDREFDQTAKTEPPAPIGMNAVRHVSPAILEQRIITLKRELDFANADRRDLAERLRVANSRIEGFERFSASLAVTIDEINEAARTRARCWRPCTTPQGIAACILDNDHAGACKGE